MPHYLHIFILGHLGQFYCSLATKQFLSQSFHFATANVQGFHWWEVKFPISSYLRLVAKPSCVMFLQHSNFVPEEQVSFTLPWKRFARKQWLKGDTDAVQLWFQCFLIAQQEGVYLLKRSSCDCEGDSNEELPHLLGSATEWAVKPMAMWNSPKRCSLNWNSIILDPGKYLTSVK